MPAALRSYRGRHETLILAHVEVASYSKTKSSENNGYQKTVRLGASLVTQPAPMIVKEHKRIHFSLSKHADKVLTNAFGCQTAHIREYQGDQVRPQMNISGLREHLRAGRTLYSQRRDCFHKCVLV